MSRHQTSSWNITENTQLPQDTSARQTSTLFSSLEPLLQGAVTLGRGKYKGTFHKELWSPYQSSGVILQLIKYYYIIFGLTPIIPRVLHCLLAYFHCSDPGYPMQECEDTVVYIM